MKSFVVFSISKLWYGIDIESVKRILPAQKLTHIPNSSEHIEGMFQYEGRVIKVLSSRHLTGELSYSQELEELFPNLKEQHKEWIDALVESVDKGVTFTKTTDPHACNLGKWIDSFHPENVEVMHIMQELNHHHQLLHHSAVDVLKLSETCVSDARHWIEDNVQDIYKSTISCLCQIEDKAEAVAVDFQRCLILNAQDGTTFGMNIDEVEDIVHVEESALSEVSDGPSLGGCMNVSAVMDYKDHLVSIIKDVKINK